MSGAVTPLPRVFQHSDYFRFYLAWNKLRLFATWHFFLFIKITLLVLCSGERMVWTLYCLVEGFWQKKTTHLERWAVECIRQFRMHTQFSILVGYSTLMEVGRCPLDFLLVATETDLCTAVCLLATAPRTIIRFFIWFVQHARHIEIRSTSRCTAPRQTAISFYSFRYECQNIVQYPTADTSLLICMPPRLHIL